MPLPSTSDVADYILVGNTKTQFGGAIVSCSKFGAVEKNTSREFTSTPNPSDLVTRYHGRMSHSLVLT